MPEALVGSFGVQLSSVPLADFSRNTKNADLSAAVAALPASLQPQSNFILIKTCSADPKRITLRMSVPRSVASLYGLDLYTWENKLRQWQWVGGEVDSTTREIVAHVTSMPASLMLMKTSQVQPVLGAEMAPLPLLGVGGVGGENVTRQVPDGVAEVSSLGLYLGDLGGMSGDRSRLLTPRVLSAANATAKVVPAIRNWGENGEVNRTLLGNMLSNDAMRDMHVANLVSLTEIGGYEGVEVDYRGIAPEQRDLYTKFIELLAQKLAAKNKVLVVGVPAPTRASGDPSTSLRAGFELPNYDLFALGKAAWQIKLDLSTNPTVLWSDELDELIRWATGQVNRYKLQLVVPSLSVKQDANGRIALIGFEEALRGLGSLEVGGPEGATTVLPSAKLKLGWRNSVNPAQLHYYPRSEVFCYSYMDSRGIQQTVWLGTAASLKKTLKKVEGHNIRGVTIRGLGRPDNDERVLQVANDFVTGDLDTSSVPEPGIKVKFTSERWNREVPIVLSRAPNNTAFDVEAPNDEGEYDIEAYFDSAKRVPIGYRLLIVSKTAPVPGSEDGLEKATATAAQSRLSPTGSGMTTTAKSDAAKQPSPILPDSAPDPIGGGGAAKAGAGSGVELSTPVATSQPVGRSTVFELGGQVWDLNHVAQMKGAGMSWVKTEIRNSDLPADFINEAKAKGMKVLVTAVGDRAQVMDPTYRDQWTQHLAKLAAAGVDAIEVWNEPNLDTEWPAGQINGATYAELLKKAYAAIKGANPNTLVISAGLAQTNGLFGGACSTNGCDDAAFLAQMASAGAKDAMDCIGAHYTSGSTAPGATTGSLAGSHYSWYYQPLRDTYLSAFNGERDICFTALGYVTAVGFKSGMPSNYAFAAGTTLDNHAKWLAEAATLSKESGKVRLMIVWNVDSNYWQAGDPSTGSGGDPQAGYAIIRPDGVCPACETLWSVMGSR